jgi:ribosomal 50S subunit-recycling heat shock protein
VGGKPQKPSYEVKIGDIITIKFGLKTVKVKVLMTDNPRKDDLMYELIEESKTTS